MDDWFSDWDWQGIVRNVVQGIPQLVAGSMAGREISDANTQGAQLAAAGNERAAQIAAANAAENRRVLAEANAPAIQYLQGVMAHNPNQLTPEQGIQVSDARRRMVNATPSGLRGSGRYLSAAVGDVENRVKGRLLTENQNRADTSAARLGNLSAGMGTQIAGQNTDAARTGATSAAATGQEFGNATTATGLSNAALISDIGSFFANAAKEGERESRYGRYKASLEGM